MPSRRLFSLGMITCSVFGPVSAGNAAATDFTISIFRKYSSDKCTSGYLSVDGKIIAYTLELPWNGNAPVISSIPVGSYQGILRYDHTDAWRIELSDVPGRTNIQIHMGNSTDDTEGCILIGTGLNDDLCSLQGGSSQVAYDALRTAFYGTPNPNSTPDKNIIVNVES